MAKLVSMPFHGQKIVHNEGRATTGFQSFLTELELKLNGRLLGEAVILDSYTVLTVPDATAYTGGMIFVSDETGGAVPAFSDGTDWRRVTDRAIVT